MGKRKSSWKQLLSQHSPSFLKWLEESNIRLEVFLKLVLDLEKYLLEYVFALVSTWPTVAAISQANVVTPPDPV